MFPFGHVGITVGLVRVAKQKADLRVVAAMSVAADLIDKPIGLLYPEAFGNNTRLAAHSLIACIAVFLILRHFRSRIPHYRLYALIYLFHMAQDRMWRRRELPIFFWPLLGKAQAWAEPAFERWHYFFTNTYTWVSEAIGFAVLITLFFKYKIYRAENLKRALKTGQID